MIGIVIRTLKEKLSAVVHGVVTVSVNYDTLYITIVRYNSVWTHSISNITDNLHAGLTTDYIQYCCMKEYRKYISTLFLK
jgi:hypothetical protein